MDKVILDLFRSISKLLKMKFRWAMLCYLQEKITSSACFVRPELSEVFSRFTYGVFMARSLLETTDAVKRFFKCGKRQEYHKRMFNF